MAGLTPLSSERRRTRFGSRQRRWHSAAPGRPGWSGASPPAPSVRPFPCRCNRSRAVPCLARSNCLDCQVQVGRVERGSEGEKRGHLRPRCGRGLGSNGACLSRFRAGNQTLGPASPGILPRRWGRQGSQLPAVSHCPEADPHLGSDRPDRPSGDPCPQRPLPRRRRSGTAVD